MGRLFHIPRLLQAVLMVTFIYVAAEVVFGLWLTQPIPKSLMTMYMFFIVAGVFMVFTFTEESTRQLTSPIKALVEDPSKKLLRNVVFAVVPILAAQARVHEVELLPAGGSLPNGGGNIRGASKAVNMRSA